MHIIDQHLLGGIILILLAALVVVKRATTGSILEKPGFGVLLWLVNIFNLFFLLVANPLAAIMLLAGKGGSIDPSYFLIEASGLLIAVEIIGLIIYIGGFLLMMWALIRLGKNYQLGGSDPRATDVMIAGGPYAFVRHPMYTAALGIAFGLACLVQSLACLIAFFLYLVLILLLIPDEEEKLRRAYGETYILYQQKVRKVLPFLF